MEKVIEFILHAGVPVILTVVYAESGLLIGFLFPGDSLLFMAGAFARSGILPIWSGNIHFFVALVALAAILGDSTGYAFGRRVGRKLFERENARFFKKKYMIQAEKFYEKHGAKAIVLARFVPIVRTFAPIVAGVSKMHYRTFLFYNIFGGILWTTLFIYLGYIVGDVLIKAGVNIELVAIAIILLSVSPMVIHALKDKSTREKFFGAIKFQFDVLFRKKPRHNRSHQTTTTQSQVNVAAADNKLDNLIIHSIAKNTQKLGLSSDTLHIVGAVIGVAGGGLIIWVVVWGQSGYYVEDLPVMIGIVAVGTALGLASRACFLLAKAHKK